MFYSAPVRAVQNKGLQLLWPPLREELVSALRLPPPVDDEHRPTGIGFHLFAQLTHMLIEVFGGNPLAEYIVRPCRLNDLRMAQAFMRICKEITQYLIFQRRQSVQTMITLITWICSVPLTTVASRKCGLLYSEYSIFHVPVTLFSSSVVGSWQGML